jgi:hypothetical protein
VAAGACHRKALRAKEQIYSQAVTGILPIGIALSQEEQQETRPRC